MTRRPFASAGAFARISDTISSTKCGKSLFANRYGVGWKSTLPVTGSPAVARYRRCMRVARSCSVRSLINAPVLRSRRPVISTPGGGEWSRTTMSGAGGPCCSYHNPLRRPDSPTNRSKYQASSSCWLAGSPFPWRPRDGTTTCGRYTRTSFGANWCQLKTVMGVNLCASMSSRNTAEQAIVARQDSVLQ